MEHTTVLEQTEIEPQPSPPLPGREKETSIPGVDHGGEEPTNCLKLTKDTIESRVGFSGKEFNKIYQEMMDEGLDVEETKNLCEFVLDSDWRPFSFILGYNDNKNL